MSALIWIELNRKVVHGASQRLWFLQVKTHKNKTELMIKNHFRVIIIQQWIKIAFADLCKASQREEILIKTWFAFEQRQKDFFFYLPNKKGTKQIEIWAEVAQ